MTRPTDAPIGASPQADRPARQRDAVQRWRLVVAREAAAPPSPGVVAHDDGPPAPPGAPGRAPAAAPDWAAAFAASGLAVAGTDAIPPRLRFAVAAPLRSSIAGDGELVDLLLVERLPVWRVREALVDCLPEGWRLVALHDVWLGEPALPGQVVAAVYRADLGPGAPAIEDVRPALAAMLAARSIPRERRKAERVVAFDLREFVEDLEAATVPGSAGGVAVRMTLRHDPERGVGRPEDVVAELGERLGVDLGGAALTRERLVLASDRATPSGHASQAPDGAAGRAGSPTARRPAGPSAQRVIRVDGQRL